jgi:hypothetical protein
MLLTYLFCGGKCVSITAEQRTYYIYADICRRKDCNFDRKDTYCSFHNYMFVVVCLLISYYMHFLYMLYLNFEGCKDNKMMDLINEGKKTRCNKQSKKQEDMSKTPKKKDSNTSCFRSVRNKKIPARYLD